ncbi:hypothetical protein MC885_017299 [Smutsia gigantea]|nr:hypothetical protein MC885_017299 [Smutsia gigantea]
MSLEKQESGPPPSQVTHWTWCSLRTHADHADTAMSTGRQTKGWTSGSHSPPLTGTLSSSGPACSQPTDELTAPLWTLWPRPLPPKGPSGPLAVRPGSSAAAFMTRSGLRAQGSACPAGLCGEKTGWWLLQASLQVSGQMCRQEERVGAGMSRCPRTRDSR